MGDRPTMQDVLQRFYPGYLDSYVPNTQQEKVVRHILNCKTGAYGVNVSRCSSCGHVQFHNNSCRDRSCPMCQALSNELWIDAQNEHVLDIDYYHIVFTCPSELNPLIYCNQKEMYSLFFHTVAETVMELSGNPAHLGGFPEILRIWEGRRVLSVSCIHGLPISLTIRTYMCYAQAEDWMQTGTGTRKGKVSSCPERQLPKFSKENSFPV